MQTQAKVISVLVSALFSGLAFASPSAESLAKQLKVHIDVKGAEAEKTCKQLGADWATCYRSTITLSNTGSALNDKNFSIIIPSPRRILSVAGDQFKIEHITGDLNRLTPTDKFMGIAAGKSIQIDLISEYWHVSDYDTFPRWMVSANGQTKTIKNTDTEDVTRFATPLSTAQAKRASSDENLILDTLKRYDVYTAKMDEAGAKDRIIPAPIEQKINKPDSVSIKNGLFLNNIDTADHARSVFANSLKKYQLLAQKKEQALVVNVAVAQDKIQLAAAKKAGGYTLMIKDGVAQVYGFDAAGAMNGFNSLLSLVDIKSKDNLSEMVVNDAPRYEYRGMMLDSARNFKSKQHVFNLIEQMSELKLNKLHLHLSDDEGWRLQINGLDELTSVGAQRGFNSKNEQTQLLPQLGHGTEAQKSDGFYTRADFIEILKYAKDRNIEVIPEIDMPGHSRAAVVSMEARYNHLMKSGNKKAAEQYRLLDPTDTSQVTTVQFYDKQGFMNVCLPSAKNFAKKVIAEVNAMYAEAGLQLTTWHYGGDEAKNIMLGGGYASAADAKPGQGIIDKKAQNFPYEKSQACQALVKNGTVASFDGLTSWFGKEINKELVPHQINSFQSWQDGLTHLKSASEMTVKPTVNVWDTLFWGGTEVVSKFNQKGFDIVLSNPDYLYLDMPNEIDPSERGYYWAARANPLKKIFSFAPGNLAQNAETSVDRDGKAMTITSPTTAPNIKGISGHLWSETQRTDEQAEYMIYPRIFALAERAWNKPGWEKFQANTVYSKESKHVDKQALENDYSRFVNAIGARGLEKLDAHQIKYRLPKVGSKVVDGVLHANTEIPNVQIQYSTDGKQWSVYDANHKPAVSGSLYVRTSNADQSHPRFGQVSKVQ
ncbi:family 20 glycosylhydrolase [Iodobacter ciconiae]|nr:family 20 glycosylhydrolase [Iodobacter ciconiae]